MLTAPGLEGPDTDAAMGATSGGSWASFPDGCCGVAHHARASSAAATQAMRGLVAPEIKVRNKVGNAGMVCESGHGEYDTQHPLIPRDPSFLIQSIALFGVIALVWHSGSPSIRRRHR